MLVIELFKNGHLLLHCVESVFVPGNKDSLQLFLAHDFHSEKLLLFIHAEFDRGELSLAYLLYDEVLVDLFLAVDAGGDSTEGGDTAGCHWRFFGVLRVFHHAVFSFAIQIENGGLALGGEVAKYFS